MDLIKEIGVQRERAAVLAQTPSPEQMMGAPTPMLWERRRILSRFGEAASHQTILFVGGP